MTRIIIEISGQEGTATLSSLPNEATSSPQPEEFLARAAASGATDAGAAQAVSLALSQAGPIAVATENTDAGAAPSAHSKSK